MKIQQRSMARRSGERLRPGRSFWCSSRGGVPTAQRCLNPMATVAPLLLAMLVSPSWAQTTAPGPIEREFQSPLRMPAQEAPVQPSIQSQAAPEGAEDVRFILRDVSVEGNSIYSQKQLRTLYAKAIGKEISLADVFVLAADMTSKYRNDGYILTQVVVPEQSIRDGLVHLRVIEGFVAEVRTQGSLRGPTATVESQLQRIRDSRPLTSGVLERSLLLANDLPGVSVSSVLSPGMQANAADLDVMLQQKKADFTFGINNRGNRSLGPTRVDAGLFLNSVLSGHDRLGLRAVQTIPDDELTYVSGSYERVLNSHGLKASLNVGRVDAKPEPLFQNFLIPTNSTSAAVGLEYPFIRSRITNLTGRLSLSYFDGRTDTTVGGITQALAKDNVRAARVGFSVDTLDRFRGVNLLDFEVSQGLKALNATDFTSTPPPTRLYGRPDFAKTTLYIARLQSLFPRWALLTALTGQYAFNPLPVSEQFSVGGEQFGRGYDPAELLGDSGAAGKVELRFSADTSTWLRSYTLYSFYDIGQVQSRATATEVASSRSLASTGLGIRMSMLRWVSGFIEFAQPLTTTVVQERNKDPRVFAGLQAVF
jgi:hemolysin activation/secretion protein